MRPGRWHDGRDRSYWNTTLDRDDPDPPAVPARSSNGRDWDVCDECGGADVELEPGDGIQGIDIRCLDCDALMEGW